ncbi:hypothetical protein K1T71_006116 [Dendrolimus kikuchii]|uniref:Uncharacterized protein n=1 Tax=Dendrolimus kikuchii TaxID=765133 RepID=A0ACC1D327_9NEOP|nr:hypothetical protein K1T71_006116 [Dendrolimus kikuchii]
MSNNQSCPPPKKKRTCRDTTEVLTMPNLDELYIFFSDSSEKSDSKPFKNVRKVIPKFRLKGAGELSSVTTPPDDRVPLVLTDIQHLLLHSLLGNINLTQSPRWYVLDKCHKISQTTCLVIEGASIKHWEKYSDTLSNIKNNFKSFVETITPSIYTGSLVQELALVPLSECEKETMIIKYGSMNLALEVRKDLMTMMKAVFPVTNQESKLVTSSVLDKFPRTQLILSAWQLIEENYPLPLNGKLKDAYSDYVMTKDEYAPVTSNSPLFGLDCEMCLTSAGSELTRICLVNENHKTVYETFVKPYNSILDYLTRYSGVTRDSMHNVTKRLEDVQKELRDILPSDAILVGQSLNIDLHALKMMHPYIIDTSLIYNFTGDRNRKPKLKSLAKEFLQEDIQIGNKGHSPIEDSLASLKLVQLKLKKGIEFGDAVHTNRQKYKENINKVKVTSQYAFSIFNHMMEQKKSSLIVGCDNITGEYHTYLSKAKEGMYSDLKKTKPKKVKLSTVDAVDDVIVSLANAAGEYNFTMGHLKLEISNNNETEQMAGINQWIEKLWTSCKQSTLLVVLFSGTANDNGLAMVNIKS